MRQLPAESSFLEKDLSWPWLAEKGPLDEHVLAPFNGLLGNLLP